MRTKILLTDFENQNEIVLRDSEQKTINQYKETAAEISKFFPASVYVEISEYEGSKSFEYCVINIDNTNINVSLLTYPKLHYHFYTSLEFKNLTRYDIQRIKGKFETPQNVGVLNLKKIQNWINYLNSIDEVCLSENDKYKNDIDLFLKSIEGLSVKWNGSKKGEIVKNGIVFEFEISETYVSKKIKVDYKPTSDLETFLKLADNQYKG